MEIYIYADFFLMAGFIALAYWTKNEIELVEEYPHKYTFINRLGDTGRQVFYFGTILLASACIGLGFLLAYKTLRNGEVIKGLVIAALFVAGVLATLSLEIGPGSLGDQYPLLLKIGLIIAGIIVIAFLDPIAGAFLILSGIVALLKNLVLSTIPKK